MKFSRQILRLATAITIFSGCTNENKQTENMGPQKDTIVEKEGAAQKPNANREADTSKKSLHYKNISFNISTIGRGSSKQLLIQSTGLQNNQNIKVRVDGEISDMQVADLNKDGFPELLIFTQSAGSGSYGNIIAYSANGKKSMSQVFFPPINDNPKLKKGYMGHDQFTISDSKLIQEFPIYKENDPNSNPTGGFRRVQYKLVDGEASRKMVVEKISEADSNSTKVIVQSTKMEVESTNMIVQSTETEVQRDRLTFEECCNKNSKILFALD